MMRQRIIRSLVLLICALVAFPLASDFALAKSPSVVSKCPNTIALLSNSSIEQVHPDKVIVKPWWGRHHVHSIFVLPSEYKPSNLLIVNIRGAGTYCGLVVAVAKGFSGVYPKPGERILVGHLRTRTAIWLILQGFLDQLKEPKNWTALIIKPIGLTQGY